MMRRKELFRQEELEKDWERVSTHDTARMLIEKREYIRISTWFLSRNCNLVVLDIVRALSGSVHSTKLLGKTKKRCNHRSVRTDKRGFLFGVRLLFSVIEA